MLLLIVFLDGRRRLLHEWLHTRYGVFDEHPLTPEEAALLYTQIDTQIDTQKFYHSSKSTIEAVRYGKIGPGVFFSAEQTLPPPHPSN